ncbi:MAG TPA: ribosome-binding factor A [Candidatus Paceibacterota bacterium]|nr:ribosome-binding factor A [Candidatus Paceibacterota bacterium]
MRHTPERKESLLRDATAEFIARNANRTSLITVTRVIIDEKSHLADIMISVLPESQEAAVLDFLRRNVIDFKDFLSERVRIGRIPHFVFTIDEGEKNRQKIDRLV